MEKIRHASPADKLDRWFGILKIVLFCMPFVYLAYLRLGTGGASLAVTKLGVAYACGLIS